MQTTHELLPLFQDIWQAVKPFHPGNHPDLGELMESLKEVSKKYNNKTLDKALYALMDYYEEAQSDKEV